MILKTLKGNKTLKIQPIKEPANDNDQTKELS